jgi:hypothetical protein
MAYDLLDGFLSNCGAMPDLGAFRKGNDEISLAPVPWCAIADHHSDRLIFALIGASSPAG